MFRASCLLAAVIAAIVASTANAQRIYNLPAGSYVITGEVRVVGPVISPDGPVVPPVPPVDPVVVPDTKLGKAVVAEINKIGVSNKRHETALKLTATYQMLAEQVRADKIPLVSASEAASLISKVAIGSEAAKWAPVMALVNTELTKATSLASAAGMLDEAANAVSSTVPDSGDLDSAAELYGFDWSTFMAFLMELLKVLLPLIVS